MSALKPGTVAKATVRGRRDVLVLRYRLAEPAAAHWVSAEPIEGYTYHPDRFVHGVRPLVVLDLTVQGFDAEQLGGDIVGTLRRESGPCSAFRDVADQIEAQTRPPRIPEPGLWGVVSHDGRNYVRTAEKTWRSGEYVAFWSNIADGATLVRPGLDD